jgi:alpha-beta hydrolase superfamily lysophospholipase
MLRALARDPLVLKRARVDTLWGLTNLMDRAMADAGKLKRPVLVLYGENDEVIPEEPVEEFLARLLLSDTDAQAAFYPHGYHMLLRDLDADVVLDDIASFVADPEAPLPSGATERGAVAQAGR